MLLIPFKEWWVCRSFPFHPMFFENSSWQGSGGKIIQSAQTLRHFEDNLVLQTKDWCYQGAAEADTRRRYPCSDFCGWQQCNGCQFHDSGWACDRLRGGHWFTDSHIQIYPDLYDSISSNLLKVFREISHSQPAGLGSPAWLCCDFWSGLCSWDDAWFLKGVVPRVTR